ncbi:MULTISPECIES: hypothetical protein [unclassified Butyrivibrio]|uniref:hypothetical protein n=1 Tax=unclassified Butyrivibrio TaxID=2639466 RepID=UPI0004058A2B|nr:MULTISPECIES: hypothetical protein [unclassified Butyrivibrio]
MRKIIAGAMLIIAILLGAGSSTVTVHAAATEKQSVLTSYSEDSANADEETDEETDTDDSDEDAEVLGENREQADKFILFIEIAISLTFAVGLCCKPWAEVK